MNDILSVSYLCLFCVSEEIVSTAESRRVQEGKGKEETTQTILRRMHKIEGRQRARVTVFRRSTNFTVWLIVSSCSIGVQNQIKDPKMSMICPL